MPRSMLQLRMQALERHLRDAEDPSTWKDTLALENFFVDDVLWVVATGKIHEEAMSQLKDIEDTMHDLDRGECTEEHAWRQYVKIQRRSEHIFRECLELLGGLALRDRITDEHICRFADELIKESARAVGRPFSFAIPTLAETLSSALRRVASVRFPDWHLWTLPLVAHEYGQVLIEDHTKCAGSWRRWRTSLLRRLESWRTTAPCGRWNAGCASSSPTRSRPTPPAPPMPAPRCFCASTRSCPVTESGPQWSSAR